MTKRIVYYIYPNKLGEYAILYCPEKNLIIHSESNYSPMFTDKANEESKKRLDALILNPPEGKTVYKGEVEENQLEFLIKEWSDWKEAEKISAHFCDHFVTRYNVIKDEIFTSNKATLNLKP